MTKRQAMDQLIEKFTQVLAARSIVDIDTARQIRADHKISTDQIVAGIERWVIPPFQAGQLEDYMKSELQKAHIFSSRLLGLYKPDSPMYPKMKKLKIRLAAGNEHDVHMLVTHFTRMCKLLQM